MQTFLPYPDMRLSLRCLDNKRLGKQRVETGQLLRSLGVHLPKVDGTIPNNRRGWLNHPARLMWVGYERALCMYYNLSIDEWVHRGFRNNMPRWYDTHSVETHASFPFPPWYGLNELHASHRSNLLRKDPIYYGRLGWTEGPDLPYYWPTQVYDTRIASHDEAQQDGNNDDSFGGIQDLHWSGEWIHPD